MLVACTVKRFCAAASALHMHPWLNVSGGCNSMYVYAIPKCGCKAGLGRGATYGVGINRVLATSPTTHFLLPVFAV